MEAQKNRGKESNDDKLFGAANMRARLKDAVEDLSYLMSRGYSQKSALVVVGNRYKLNVRQQKAVQGMSASAEQIENRNRKRLSAPELNGREIVVDGFNVLILLESLLSGAYVFTGRDGFYRDLSAVHGSYKKVQQTPRAIELVADFYVNEHIGKITWYFDKPVSNSGKLKKMIEDMAAENGYAWQVLLTFQTDQDIVAENKIAVSSDAWILDQAVENFNFIGYIIKQSSYPNVILL